MRTIKQLVSKEAKRKDSCLASTLVEDCTDLTILESKLKEDEQRLHLLFTHAVRSSKTAVPPQVLRSLQEIKDQTFGRLVKLPLLGSQEHNFEWSIYSGVSNEEASIVSLSGKLCRPDTHLQAISTEWSQSLTLM